MGRLFKSGHRLAFQPAIDVERHQSRAVQTIIPAIFRWELFAQPPQCRKLTELAAIGDLPIGELTPGDNPIPRLYSIKASDSVRIRDKNDPPLTQCKMLSQPGRINIRFEQFLIRAISDDFIKTLLYRTSKPVITRAYIKENSVGINDQERRINHYIFRNRFDNGLFRLKLCYSLRQEINPLRINQTNHIVRISFVSPKASRIKNIQLTPAMALQKGYGAKIAKISN